MKQLIAQLSRQYTENLIAHRRHLHAHPEPSFEEFATRDYIVSVLKNAGLEPAVFQGGCGVVCRIKGQRPGKGIAFRADIDALRMQEENSAEICPYRSQNDGVMHACGHDGHTAVLLAFAEAMSAHRELIAGEVVCIFQHAEETPPGGAAYLIAQGALDGVDEIYGMHLWPALDYGEIGYTHGAMMAAADMFEVAFTGPGGHGSQPHNSKDVLLAACSAVEQYQGIMSRQVAALDTAVVSVCRLSSGTTYNVIPDRAELAGTVRTFSEDVQSLIMERIERISHGIADMYGIGCNVNYQKGFPALINHPDIVDRAVQSISAHTSVKPVPVQPVMIGEDYALYVKKVPGAFFFVGCRNRAKGIDCAMHSPVYQMDEDALNAAFECFLAVYLDSVK